MNSNKENDSRDEEYNDCQRRKEYKAEETLNKEQEKLVWEKNALLGVNEELLKMVCFSMV
jgi:hypothetical protein